MLESVRLIRTVYRYAAADQLHELTFTITDEGPCSLYFADDDVLAAKRALGVRGEIAIDPAYPADLPAFVSHGIVGPDPGGGLLRSTCWHDCLCRWWCFTEKVRFILVRYHYAYAGQLHELRFSPDAEGPCSMYYNGVEAGKVRDALGYLESTVIDPGNPVGLPPYVEHEVLGAAPSGGVVFAGCIWHDCLCRWWCSEEKANGPAAEETETGIIAAVRKLARAICDMLGIRPKRRPM